MFFDLDRDGSGSIDAEELGMMLRSLGQNPTDEELRDLIDSVDEGDKDGQIQLREFLKLYTQSLDQKSSGAAGKEDVDNVVMALDVRAASPPRVPRPFGRTLAAGLVEGGRATHAPVPGACCVLAGRPARPCKGHEQGRLQNADDGPVQPGDRPRGAWHGQGR